MSSDQSTPLLSASYNNPTESNLITVPLPTCPAEPSTDERTNYLTALRQSIISLQSDINVFLTQKMDQDKMQSAAPASSANEDREEENYGEELLLDDN
jgi:hypothetical protein